MKYSTMTKVVRRREFGGGMFALTLDAPEVARAAAPGQFVTVRGWEGVVPLVNRPFSIAGAGAGRIKLVIKEVGVGTDLLHRREPGDEVRVVGPLGNAFPEPPRGGATWFVAGGVGLAPFMFYVSRHKSNPGDRLFYGCCGESETGVLRGMEKKIDIELTTEDGCAGRKGFVTHALEAAFRKKKPACILACGPWGMLRAVAGLAARQCVPCLVSLETYMSCGFGACMGCAVRMAGKETMYRHVCKDGPVFNAPEIDWEARS
jgi:dihydroorotate dehydrogenase electron transfer subunit